MAQRIDITETLAELPGAACRHINRTASRLHRLRPPRKPELPPAVREASQPCRACYGTGVTMGYDGRRGHVRPYACRCGAPYQLPEMMRRIVDHLEGTEVLTAVQRGLYDADYDERAQA